MTTGERIRKARLKAGYSQKWLAQKIGKSERTVQRYEHGDGPISNTALSDIARTLDVSVRLFFDNEPPA